MTQIDVKREVERAVGLEWADFTNRHPHLAAALDQELLAEHVSALLEDDPAYRAAMDEAAALGMAMESIGSVIKRFVGDFFEKLR